MASCAVVSVLRAIAVRSQCVLSSKSDVEMQFYEQDTVAPDVSGALRRLQRYDDSLGVHARVVTMPIDRTKHWWRCASSFPMRRRWRRRASPPQRCERGTLLALFVLCARAV